ncbi:hypothetical protein JZ785_20500 [Alicyclobacillus curvatus]|nr:hypothetical protein JZ785_20500 [Alicyclobacillus curvatus]
MGDKEKAKGVDSEKDSMDVISIPGVTGAEGKPKSIFRRFWWLGASVVVVIGGLMAYLLYESHRTAVYESYLQGAENAMQNANYSLAITDYKKALTYKQTPAVQSEFATAQKLQLEHEAYKAGMSALNSGKYATAILEFDKVDGHDTADYSAAQKGIAGAKAAIAAQNDKRIATKLYGDTQNVVSDVSSITTSINSIADTENNLTSNDVIGSGNFTDDMSGLASSLSTFDSTLTTLGTDISTFNTDTPGIHDQKINGIIDKLNTALNAEENDLSDMNTIAHDDYTELQNESNLFGTPYIYAGRTSQWNADIKDSGNQQNVIANLAAELKAYINATPSSSSNNSL